MTGPKELYKIVRHLCNGVPYGLREELYTDLLVRGVKLIEHPEPYIFVALRNLKNDFMRGKRKNEPSADALEFVVTVHEEAEPEFFDHRVTEKLMLLWRFHFLFTVPQRYLFEEIVWSLYKRGFFSMRECSKKCGISPSRGYAVIRELKEKTNDAQAAQTKSTFVTRVETIDDLFYLLFPFGRRRSRPRV